MIDKQLMMLSMWQPWASLAVWRNPHDKFAEKQIETRHWSTDYRGLIAIHAAKNTAAVGASDHAFDSEIRKALLRRLPSTHNLKNDLVFGAIVGVVNLVEVKRFGRNNSWLEDYPERERRFGDVSEGRYGWIFTDQIEFKQPIYCRGLQSLGSPKPEIKREVFERLRL